VHTVLTATAPAADSTVRGEVRELRLRFSTAVQPALTTIVLSGPNGALPTGALELVPGTDEMELRVPLLTRLPSGAYTVEWITAGPDSHPINGAYAFAVELPAPPTSPPAAREGEGEPPTESLAQESSVPALLPTVVRWLLDLTVVGMIGLAAFRWLILARLDGEPSYALLALPVHRRLWGVGWAVAGLALALLPLRLGVQAIQLFGRDAVTRGGALLQNAWGMSWWLHLAAGLLLSLGLFVAGAQGRRAGWLTIALAAALVALVPGLSGHAFGEARPALMVMNDALHVTGAGAWAGGLLMVLAVGLPALREADVPPRLGGAFPALAALVARFSRLAVGAVALLAFTGVVNARVIVGSWAALFASRYGQTLLLKVALVALTALLGLYHWLVVRPELARGAGEQRLRPTARVELALALLVLVTTAVLAVTPPMADPPSTESRVESTE
jgi:copper transport protein